MKIWKSKDLKQSLYIVSFEEGQMPVHIKHGDTSLENDNNTSPLNNTRSISQMLTN